MSADQESLRVRDRAAPNVERPGQTLPSRNGQGPDVTVHIGEPEGMSNGVAPSHAGTNGTRPSEPMAPVGAATNGTGISELKHASRNGATHPKTFVTYDVDWDAYLPKRSSGLAWRVGQRVKRVLDAVLAFGMVVALLPLFLVVSLLVRLTSRGPALYVCEYVGRRGRRFSGYKFRTMVADAEGKKTELLHLNHMKGPAFKIRRDPRITSLGRVLRKFSIDELPQLWNVVKGEMSLVGPRPPLPEEWVEFKDWQRAKLTVVPGITCSWQVSGRSDIVDFDEWARLDLEYIEQWSLWEDSKLLIRTIPAVLTGNGAY
jgi:lipopolysaccharide/colanic/teichoic acid biosynthesis glycosyltransferase